VDLTIGIVIGVVISVVALTLEYRTGYFIKRKKLVYEIASETTIVDKKKTKKYARDLAVEWQGRNIDSLVVVTLVIECVGRQEIVPNDFDQPITIWFEGNILGAYLNAVQPLHLSKSLKITRGSIDPNEQQVGSLLIEPLLLNQGNFIEIALLFSEYRYLSVESHIAGVNIEKKYPFMYPLDRSDSLPIAILVGILMGILTYFIISIIVPFIFQSVAATGIESIGITPTPWPTLLP